MSHHFNSKVHFIAGKGGVGKTVVAKALAVSFAKMKKKTLLATIVEEQDDFCEQKNGEIRHKNKHLYSLDVEPKNALHEYLELKLSSKKLLNLLIKKESFNRLCSAMPGLADLIRLGKIWFHADEVHSYTHNIFDKIVVDLPSSGFVARFLSIADVTKKAVKVGPVAKEAGLIADYFNNKQNAALHFVTLAEEMIVNETLELKELVLKKCNVNLGLVFFNKALDLNSLNVDCMESLGAESKKIAYYFQSLKELEGEAIKKLLSAFKNDQLLKLYYAYTAGTKTQVIDSLQKKISTEIHNENK